MLIEPCIITIFIAHSKLLKIVFQFLSRILHFMFSFKLKYPWEWFFSCLLHYPSNVIHYCFMNYRLNFGQKCPSKYRLKESKMQFL